MPEIERDAVRLHYETIGDPAHPPVVLLHGFTSDLRMWHPVARFLAESYYLVIPDLRGHGQSASPEGLDAYHMAEYAADLEALVNELHLDLFALVGCSFGGMVAMHFAVDHPGRIAALVLSDTSPAYERPEYDDAFRQREQRITAMEDEVRRFGTTLTASAWPLPSKTPLPPKEFASAPNAFPPMDCWVRPSPAKHAPT